uniref:IstB-like ATP binding protein n=1 Tax=Candidatus Kentrum sp. MB TaxID=2138164 RepID=A0A450XZT9_9GAMM|nr:MAG: IstB-like ATP binding protein [Candidatus Kentron sp. MB]VFK34801.1 MAG: IstB-like ATP binding protein [Candidatus Kentron sp. MB]VFK74194.1 MAG: IstB-like ATP binding protein [Candidatus Kentron sp. MB]
MVTGLVWEYSTRVVITAMNAWNKLAHRPSESAHRPTRASPPSSKMAWTKTASMSQRPSMNQWRMKICAAPVITAKNRERRHAPYPNGTTTQLETQYGRSALSNQACRQGFPVRYFRLLRLLEQLRIAHGDGSYPKLMVQLAKFQLPTRKTRNRKGR